MSIAPFNLSPLDPATIDVWGQPVVDKFNEIIAALNAGAGTGSGGGTVSDATASQKGVVQLAGDLTGSAAAPQLAALVTASTVGSATGIPVITYDAKGRITATTTVSPTGGGGTGGLTVVDNGDGSAEITSGAGGTATITDNGDGSATIA